MFKDKSKVLKQVAKCHVNVRVCFMWHMCCVWVW